MKVNGKHFIFLLVFVIISLISISLVQAIDIYFDEPASCKSCIFSNWKEIQEIIDDTLIRGKLEFHYIVSSKDLKKGILNKRLRIQSREGNIKILNHIVKINGYKLNTSIKKISDSHSLFFPGDILKDLNKDWEQYSFNIIINYELLNFNIPAGFGRYSLVTRSLCLECDITKTIYFSAKKYRVHYISNKFKDCFIQEDNKKECFYIDNGSEIRARINYENIHKRNLVAFFYAFIGALIGFILTLVYKKLKFTSKKPIHTLKVDKKRKKII